MEIPLPPIVQGESAFDNIPPAVTRYLATGYRHLAALSPSSIESLAAHVSRWLDPQYPHPNSEEVAKELELDVRHVNTLVLAVTFQATTHLSSARPVAVDAFIEQARQAEIISEEHIQAVQTLGNSLLGENRVGIQNALVRARASDYVIPSFRALDSTIDLRVGAASAQGVVTMPIVMVLLSTDVASAQLAFQATPRDVEKLRNKFDELARELRECIAMEVKPPSTTDD